MRALADSERLALHDLLRRHGPATASDLASRLGSAPESIVAHLEVLEEVGLVDRSADEWAVVGKGVVFEIPEDPEGQSAARELSNVMFLQYVDLPRGWVSDDEPTLSLEWARAAGLTNARLFVTPDELRELQEGLERLLEPLLTRESDAVPAGAGHVRVLSYFMPEPTRGRE